MKKNALPPDLSAVISARAFAVRLVISAMGGVLFALALPPVNWSVLGLFTLAVLFGAVYKLGIFRAALCGWVWGIGWSLPAFFWLREIEFAVPFLIAPVLALWPAVWAGTVPWLWKRIAVPPEIRFEGTEEVARYEKEKLGNGRIILAGTALAAWWVVLEFTRSTMLPWNNLAAVTWRSPVFLPLAAYTGQYGISFLIALAGILLAMGVKFRKFLPFGAVLLVCCLIPLLGGKKEPGKTLPVRIGAVQGDISQRRNADSAQAQEALQIYLDLTEKLLAGNRKNPPDVTVWPETAVPYPFKGAGEVCLRYRTGVAKLVREYKVPLLLGTIDFALEPDGRSVKGITNSALLIAPEYYEKARFDKIHRVPFGEYIPFRALLPEFFVRAIDMNRDLVPGGNFAPVEIDPKVRAGISICFESVFPYVAREEARRGANMLLVISNDAWYPVSCEPEQHLANALFRSVETGLYSVRCGNNGGTLVISPEGKIVQVLETPGEGAMELRRGRSFGILELNVPENPPMTIYTRFGEWFTVLCALWFSAVAVLGGLNQRKLNKLFASLLAE